MIASYRKLIHRLVRLVKAKQLTYWLYEQEDGHVDISKLTRVIVNPATPMTFIKEKFTSFRPTAIAFTLDGISFERRKVILDFIAEFITPFERVSSITTVIFGVKGEKQRFRTVKEALKTSNAKVFDDYSLEEFYKSKTPRKIIVNFADKKITPPRNKKFHLIEAYDIIDEDGLKKILDTLYDIFDKD